MSCVYEVVCAYVLLESTVLYTVVCNRPQGYHLVPEEELKQLMYCIKSLCVLLLIRLVVNLQYIARGYQQSTRTYACSLDNVLCRHWWQPKGS